MGQGVGQRSPEEQVIFIEHFIDTREVLSYNMQNLSRIKQRKDFGKLWSIADSKMY